MDVPVSEIEERFDELVRLSRAGETVTVTKNGRTVAQLTAVTPNQIAASLDDAEIGRRERVIRKIQASVRRQFEGRQMPTSDHSDMYDDYGLPK